MCFVRTEVVNGRDVRSDAKILLQSAHTPGSVNQMLQTWTFKKRNHIKPDMFTADETMYNISVGAQLWLEAYLLLAGSGFGSLVAMIQA